MALWIVAAAVGVGVLGSAGYFISNQLADPPPATKSFDEEEMEAIKKLHREAEAHYRAAVKAQFNLAVMYATGRGVDQQFVPAHMWFNVAASTGHARSAEGRDIVAKRMSASQITEAQELAQACIKKQFKGCLDGTAVH